MRGPFRVNEVIDSAISENRSAERILLGIAGLFLGLGTTVLIVGLIRDSVVAYAGVVESVLFVPAVSLVLRIRKENIALRILEIPLRKARTAQEAERVLIDFFRSTHGIRSGEKAGLSEGEEP